MNRVLALIVLNVALVRAVVAQDGPAQEPAGLRSDNYRAPTPAGLRGARTVTTEQAAALWRSHGAAFVDVLARPPRPKNLPAETIYHEKSRRDIPGSVWLPNTGYGQLNPTIERYFEDGLNSASQGDQSNVLVFYCLKECWMSWNAAKRALEKHYENVVWYPDGTDGWSAAGLPLEEAQPLPGAN